MAMQWYVDMQLLFLCFLRYHVAIHVDRWFFVCWQARHAMKFTGSLLTQSCRRSETCINSRPINRPIYFLIANLVAGAGLSSSYTALAVMVGEA